MARKRMAAGEYAIALRGQMEVNRRARVEFDPETEEYVVLFWKDGAQLDDADYFTNDLDDAMGTMRHWLIH